ncbi:hypothetical protein BDN70DRAFT_926863 [Pholiota conissans]|uniref:Uncharacterized protein n=1 Tax=Pholiota conissans TaxID=109636 RepID=A0A9P6D7Z9_9AGAR|nr:hypothetical protein BDN70DRAFT_926863 [Pholiota conissans]
MPVAIAVPEIVDLIVSNLLDDLDFERALTMREQRDLSACSLVSLAFYTASRRYLFATVIIDLKLILSERSCTRAWSRIRDLLQILSSNPMLQQRICHLRVVLRTNLHTSLPSTEDSTNLWTTSSEQLIDTSGTRPFRLRESGFDDLLHLLPSLKALSICSRLESEEMNEVLSSLGVLRSHCANLHRLRLSGIINMDPQFLSQWVCITDFQATDGMSFSRDYSNLLTNMPLERFHVRLILNRGSTLDLPRLNWSRFQNLRLDVRADRDVVYGLLFRLSGGMPALKELRLRFAFCKWPYIIIRDDAGAYSSGFDITPPLSMSLLPSLKILYINDVPRNPKTKFLRNLSHFLSPKEPTILNIECINLRIIGDDCTKRLLLKSTKEWSRIDRAFTSHQYANLRKVNIDLVLYEHVYYSTFEEMLTLRENFPFSVLPLTCASQSVHVQSSFRCQFE